MPIDKQILVVDDDPSICTLIHTVLKFAGHSTVSSNLGREAYRLLVSCPNLYKLLILDVQMPDIQGTELIEMLKIANLNVPVIVISGYAKCVPDDIAFLRKPFSCIELLDIVDSKLKGT